MRRALLVPILALAFVPHAASGPLPLPTRLANALAVRGNSPADSGAVAIDLQNGRVLFERNADLSLEPASNEKLTVTFAALRELGAAYRFRTEVLGRGRQEGTVWHGDIFLKGFGDPTLSSRGLAQLAAQLAQLGITRVDGRLLADESWFDDDRTAPGWKPDFYILECPPLSALVANRAVYEKHVAVDPAIAAAGTLRKLLRARGILTGPVGRGQAPSGTIALAQTNSQQLWRILDEMDHSSDNFVAEMLLKELGAERGLGGTTAAGATVVTQSLQASGIPLTGVRIVDGSGLSLLDRISANALATLLETAWNQPNLRVVFWNALPVAGRSGTLEHRMEQPPAVGNVRAKTGTTDEASALAGYAGERYAFAVLQNGNPVSADAARKAQDRFATALASAAGE